MNSSLAVPRHVVRFGGLISLVVGICVTSAFAGPGASITLVPSIGTLAGNGTFGFTTGPGVATALPLEQPIGMATDAVGNFYFADGNLNAVWKIDRTSGIMKIIAGIPGPSVESGDGGPATSARFRGPEGVRFDQAGNLYIVDTGGFVVRKVNTSGIISTVAGTPKTPGYTGDGGLATSATLGGASYIAFDHSDNLYITDLANNVIRRVDATTHVISTFAGNNSGTATVGDGDVATNTKFNIPNGIELDSKGNLYICERGNNAVRMVAAGTGIVSTVAGDGTAGSSGDGGAATSAELNSPWSVTLDSNDNLYITDFGNHTVRRVDAISHIITTVAGTAGSPGYSGDGGAATNALLDTPTDLLFERKTGNLYVAVPSFNLNMPVIRSVVLQAGLPNTTVGATSSSQNLVLDITGTLTINSITVPTSQGGTAEYTVGSLSGTGCSVGSPIAGGVGTNCILPVTFSPRYPGIRNVPLIISATVSGTPTTFRVGLTGEGLGPQAAFSPAVITTVAGTSTAGYSGDSGLATAATFHSPAAVAVDYAGNLYISDTANNVVRRVDAATHIVTTIAGNGTAGYSGDASAATAAELHTPYGIAFDSAGNLSISDSSNNVIRQVNASTGKIFTVAGIGDPGYTGDNDFAVSATLYVPYDLTFDSSGNYFIADHQNNAIRRVEANSNRNQAIINTIAGNGSAGSSADGLLAFDSLLDLPSAMTIDSAGNLYVADSGNFLVRKISVHGGMKTVAGSGVMGSSGDDGVATSAELKNVLGLAVDSAGNLYIADSGNNVLREVNAVTQIIRTLAGDGTGHTSGYSGDNDVPTSALLSAPEHPAIDSAGNLYFADTSNNVVRKIGTTAAPLTFTATPLGSSSSAQDVTITNNGNAKLTFSTLTAPADFNLSGADNTCTTSTSLASGSSCVLGIVFAPASLGSLSETLTITDNQGTHTIILSGMATAVTTTTTLSISPSPATAGQATTFTATISPVSTGTVNFYCDSTLLGSGTVNALSGVASFTTNNLTAGTCNATAVYSGNSGYATSTSSVVSLTINAALTSTTTTLSITPSPATAGQTTTFTAAVSPVATGTVSFYCGSTLLGSGTVNESGVASFTTSSLTAGACSSTAVYSGNSGYATSTSSVVSLTINAALTSTTTTLSITPSPATAGQATTFTATVTPAATGTVSFYCGSTLLGSSAVNASSGVASFTTSSLTAGTCGATAVYSGNSGYATSTSSAASLTINAALASTTTTLSISPSPATAGQATTFTATISPAATGTVSFYCGSTLLGSSAVNASSGAASFTTSSLTAGTCSATAVYSGNSGYATSTSSVVSLAINAALTSTATTLSITPSPATAGQATTFTATVSPAPSGSTRGTVSFYNGSTFLGTEPVNVSGVASLTNGSMTANSYSITAVYSGVSGVYSSSTSSAQSLAVSKTAVAVTVAALQVTSGQTGSAAVTVTGPYQTLAAPSGTVSYVLLNASGTTVGSGELTLTAGSTSATTSVSVPSTLAAGTYTLKIVGYSGDSNYAASSTLLATASITISQLTPTITWSPSSSISYGSTLSGILSAVASNGGSSVAGTFSYQATPSGGSASTVTSASVLAAGSYALTVTFTPTGTTYTTATKTITFTVARASATSSVVSSANPVFVTTAITVTATVSSSAGTPTGSVSFYDGATLLGAISLSGGAAAYTTSSLASGTHALTAVYAGDSNFAGATSSSLAEVVQDFSLGTPASGSGGSGGSGGTGDSGSNAPTQIVLPGDTATFSVALGPTNGVTLAAPVTLTVTGAPPGATATLNPSYLPAGASLTNVALTVVLPKTIATLHQNEIFGRKLETVLWGMFLLPFAARIRKAAGKLRHLACILLVVLAGTGLVMGISGCATNASGYFGQQQKSYTLVITATSGTVSRSTSVNLTIQ